MRSKMDGFCLASSEPIILNTDSLTLPFLSLIPAADLSTIARRSPSPASAKTEAECS